MTEERYRFLEHTADAKFQAYGRTLEEAFANAALATASLMWDTASIARKVRIPVRARGRDLEQLLVRFLEEILYLVESRFFLLASAEELKIEQRGAEYELEAVFWGDTSSDSYEAHGGVKAVTYNEMKISKDDGYTIQVVVDV
jgi:SHS2 domain-containing protein